MIKNAINFKRLFIIALMVYVSSCVPLLAATYKTNIGLSYMYANINDKDFDYVNKYEMVKSPKDQLGSLTLGFSAFYDNVNITISSNRLLNNDIKRTVKRKSDGLIFHTKTKTIIDSLNVGYNIQRFNPGLVLANVAMSKHLFYQGDQAGYLNKHAIVGGFSLGYFITRHLTPSIIYILPNSELGLESAFSININYLF